MTDSQFEYQIECLLQAIEQQPWNVAGHQELRDVALRRKAAGGKDLGMFAKMKLRLQPKDPVHAMLCAERLLAFDPGNSEHMVMLHQHADRAGFEDVAEWIRAIINKVP